MAIKVLRPVLLAAAAVLVLSTGLAVGADTTADDAYAAGSPAPIPAPAEKTVSPVGALFANGGHFCSASVVHSGTGDLVLTAAHCVRNGMSFAPGYHDGVAPLGMWPVTGTTVAEGWTSSADPDLDFAFLTVQQPGNPASLESLTGANALGVNRGFDHRITLTGYPDTTDSPVVCDGTTTRSDTYQMQVACPGFPDGTSGGPWVTGGEVIGVIGGYRLGGDTPDVSYSAYFDDDIAKLYATATG
ncbi:S1 family peptidase [Amycolatopsis eburnea]|uniref:Serine protease n=1 Tax=Amycolatopsis eburnea TaxID=2267691 RepID=A0A3R9FLY6_9PSEU|nr:serine protease [Amycolatopsis eburnea]RSD16465.1 serine protease [Amycolatopsis eburnea]